MELACGCVLCGFAIKEKRKCHFLPLLPMGKKVGAPHSQTTVQVTYPEVGRNLESESTVNTVRLSPVVLCGFESFSTLVFCFKIKTWSPLELYSSCPLQFLMIGRLSANFRTNLLEHLNIV